MLVRFTVENFRSFHGEAVLSMIPGRMRKHPHHIVRGHASHKLDVLKIGLMYGANASGKSNLIKAINFARTQIVDGLKPNQSFRVPQFRLGKADETKLTRFEFEIVIDDVAYAYGFEIDQIRVHEEWLYQIGKNKEIALFERKTDSQNNVQVSFPNPQLLTEGEDQFREFFARKTHPNQLYLTTSVDDNVSDFKSVFNWFKHTLSIVYPDTRAHGVEIRIHNDEEFASALSQFLRDMNTRVDRVCLHPVDIDRIPLPQDLIDSIISDLNPDGQSGSVINAPNGGRYFITLDIESGEPTIWSLGTIHRALDGREVQFEIFEESDGTQRLIDLFPILYTPETKLFVVDELERSLHPNLMWNFLERLLETQSSSQLLVTTHESTLIDFDLLRRDEILFVEKSPQGQSVLYSLDEFKEIRVDLDIRKGYLNGRFGAIPVWRSRQTQCAEVQHHG